MSLAIVHTRAQEGIHSPAVRVEVHLAGGLPGLSIVGLPEAAVKESKDRVRAALMTAGFEFPTRRITISLAPADLPKEGGRFDLPIAIGILAASGQVPVEALKQREFLGELSLTGQLRSARGVFTAALAAGKSQRELIIPTEDAAQAAMAGASEVLAAASLLEVCRYLHGELKLEFPPPETAPAKLEQGPDLLDVVGQHQARRALEVAAAGGHNLLFVGPPGTGKTMLASRLPGILPPLSEREAMEAAAIASISQQPLQAGQWKQRRFRAPHHTASGVALVGGGSRPKPGEISLAHQGVLFLDELPEFDRRVLDVLREPLESGRIIISRAARQAEFPARFQLVAAMNPCPCGFADDGTDRCLCTPMQVQRYRSRVSGPLLDRIDVQIEVPRLETGQLNRGLTGEPSSEVRARVIRARQAQMQRSGTCNAQLSEADLRQHCELSENDRQLLETAMDHLRLSARASQRILRMARTIADLAQSATIQTPHLSEAIGYRRIKLH
ncbi:MAG: YifB family Mg chelatase-like AAA ATPase [Xanthomonadales bacterium]|nr:YifB family Mg chelatase-like AAA ATPase [Xanthomonadales bacterium]